MDQILKYPNGWWINLSQLNRDMNMEENKYYIPEISEFHVGFEFEYKSSDDTWWGTSYDPLRAKEDEEDYIVTLGVIKKMIQHEEAIEYIRVKYLDQSDIESLGFRLLKDYTIEQEYQTQIFKDKDDNDYWWELMIDDKEDMTKITIEHWMDDGKTSYSGLIFNGTIKNVSELKVLMKQLGINEAK